MNSEQLVALVTGSSKGIGKSIARKLVSNNYHVFITYNTDKKGAEELHSQIGIDRSTVVNLDVRDEDSVKGVMETIEEKFGKLDVLVNNAGIEIPKIIEDLSFNEWKTVTETKINGTFLCSKYALPLLKNSENPNIINITSSLGQNPSYMFPAYCTGTAGVDTLTKILAVGFAKYKIRTNSIAPAQTLTPMWDSMGGNDPAMWKQFADENPLGRVSTPEDIAEVVLSIVSDKTKYINGNIIYVNGGDHLT
jgi:NAD(P)-dependent dehydrogenase (short-subunit alcohol dehydrogenase family)